MLGSIEPHKLLLNQPQDDQILYKIMKWEHFYLSVIKSYLHFNRVDLYDDVNDGEQLPLDRMANKKIGFFNSPSYTLDKCYDDSRTKTYACCLSLEHSDYMWKKYGNEGRDSLCLVINFGKLRQLLNQTSEHSISNHGLIVPGIGSCQQIFSINYGLVTYIDKTTFSSINCRKPNAIKYTYYKDKKWEKEKELRISLSASIVNYQVKGTEFPFLPSIQLHFDFQKAFDLGIIVSIIVCDPNVREKLKGLGIQELA